MRGWVNGTLIAALLLIGEQASGANCRASVRSPEEIVARIDLYRAAPRHPATYRALAGLGDPHIDPGIDDVHYGNAPEPRRALIDQMFPDQRSPDDQYWFPDFGACRPGYAIATAEDRVARLGRDHPYVAHWLRTQRIVFSACRRDNPWAAQDEGAASSRPPVALPPPMATADPALRRLQRDDRAYQAASILFYQRDPGARRAFRDIADGESPHAPIARYMLLALDARDLGYVPYEEKEDERARRIARAHAALGGARAILADRELAAIHPLVQGLIGYLGYWTGDEQVRTAQADSILDALAAPLSRLAADPVARDRYRRALDDIDWLRRDLAGEASPRSATLAGSSAVRGLAARARRDPFAAWLIAGVSPHEREPWIRHRRGLGWYELQAEADRRGRNEPGRAWAVLGASLASYYEPAGWRAIDALIAETRACPSDDRLAAIATLFYHQVRTALMYPALDDDGAPRPVRDAFAVALAHVEAWPWRQSAHHRELVSDMLQFLAGAGRLEEARTLRNRVDLRGEDQWHNAPALLLLAEDEDHLAREVAAMPEAGQALVNLLSARALARLAERPDLPAAVRARFARVAWTRLYALQRRIPRRLDRSMRRLNPAIAGRWTSSPGARPGSRALLLDVLRSPGLNILIVSHQRGSGSNGYAIEDPGPTGIDTFEHSDNNWWCAWQPDRHELTAAATLYSAFFAPEDEWDPMAAAGTAAALGPLLRESWLWRSRDRADEAALAAIPIAPRLLAERAVAWRPPGLLGWLRGRDGQDEALALAVRATRYGCQRQGGHRAYSRAAFALLHARFPSSEAARRTPYWFDCAHFSGGCAGRPGYQPEWRRWAGRPWHY